MIETKQKIRAVIVDDQEVVRIGLRSALEGDGRIEIVGEGQTAAEALRLVQTHRPDVLLLGLNAIGNSATADGPLLTCDAIRSLVKNSQTSVLVLSRHTHKGLVRLTLSAGASGFMCKDEAMNSCAALAQATMVIAWKKKLPLSPALSEKLYRYNLDIADVPQLTPRRIEIMQTIADNPQLTLAQVADQLGIAESTLRNNLSAVSRALDTPNVNGAMIECLRLGLVQISQ
jgi:DNA-binding NarL/FixJ family response regulator